jgi:predicted ATPase/DNA-binding SARP family transcriptional activator
MPDMGGDAADARLMVGLLGPVEIGPARGPMAPVAQPRLRVLLGLLGVAAGRVVSAESLVDGVWGEDWSPARGKNLHALVYQLRRRLTALEQGGGARLARVGAGYRLALGPGEVDAAVFRELAGHGREAARAGDTTAARELFAQALKLWRGAALADTEPLCPVLAGEAARLEEQRLAVVEERIECDLALGRHAEVAAELAVLAGEFPLRERLTALLMTALYRCGRRGEALAVFDTARRVLATELGLDPGPELAGLQAKVLADDPALAAPAPAAAEVLAARAEAPGALAGNLPVQLSSFVGRVAELAELATAMRRSPLVTVVGVGGVGKTRLALYAAAQQVPSFRDGAWLCELHAAVDEETMAQAVIAALRVRPRPGISVAASIVEFLRTKTALLLVLDNCEHLRSAPAVLAAGILRGCRGVHILATSRQPLGVEGEQVFGLRPLPLPAPAAGVAAAAGSDAVTLFVQRATAARGDFCLGLANVDAVGEICRRLDGIPLAIELAAARVAALRPAEIAGLLDERFRLLTRGRADAAGRHQTLQATVEWSYALLSDTERHVFDRLGVFPASFDAAAAAAVAGADGLQRWDILDSLTALVGKSMVVEEEGPGQTSRYRLLETIRAYARQHLAAIAEAERLARRHAEHYMAFAEQAGPELLGPRQLHWQHRIRAELDNLQAAVTWAMTGGDQTYQLAFRVVAALAFSAISTRSTVGAWAERVVPQIGTCPPELRATVLGAAAWSAFLAGDLPLAQRRAEDALRQPASSDPNSLGMPKTVLSRTYALTGQPERGASIAQEARQQAAQRGWDVYAGAFYAMEAMAWTDDGNHAAARRPAIEAVEVTRKVGNPGMSATACYAAAQALWLTDPQTARTLLEDSLVLTRAGALDSIHGFALSLAGAIRARTGDLPGALTVLHEATLQLHRDGNRLGLGVTLQRAAAVLARLGDPEPAAILAGAVAAHFTVTVGNIHAQEQAEIDDTQSNVRRALGEAAYTTALRRGAAMDDHEMVEYTLAEFRRLAAVSA